MKHLLLNTGGVLVFLTAMNKQPEVTFSSHPLSVGAFGLLARLQSELQRSLHLGSACNGDVQQQAGSSGGAQVQGVFSSLGKQEDSGSPATL